MVFVKVNSSLVFFAACCSTVKLHILLFCRTLILSNDITVVDSLDLLISAYSASFYQLVYCSAWWTVDYSPAINSVIITFLYVNRLFLPNPTADLRMPQLNILVHLHK